LKLQQLWGAGKKKYGSVGRKHPKFDAVLMAQKSETVVTRVLL